MNDLRQWEILIVACVLGVLAWGCTREERPRSLLVITVDTTRADRLGCYGYGAAHTPNLDRLAVRGIQYERAYATVPETLPSHASIFTGLYARSHGVRLNLIFQLPDEAVTLAELLSGRGMRTIAVCSSVVLDQKFGLNQGFQHYDGPGEEYAQEHEVEWSAEEVTTRALTYIAETEDQPFFLWVHYYDPHSPWEPRPPFSALEGAIPESSGLYDLEIAYMDLWIGVLLDELEERGVIEDTLVIVVGDHGESLGEHGETYHSLFVYDSTIHVPLILVGPGVAPGERINEVVSLVDIYSTILALFDIDSPSSSSRVLPGLKGIADKARHDRIAISDSMSPPLRYGWNALEALRTENWLYIRAPSEELYRLDGTDPAQEVNLALSEPETVELLRNLLTETVRFMPDEGFRDQTGHLASEQQVQALAALGYLSGDAKHVPEEAGTGADPKDMVEVAEAFELACLARRQGKTETARDLLMWATAVDPENFAVWVELGRTLFLEKRDLDAWNAFDRALNIRPGFWRVLVEMAAVEEQLDRPAAAEGRLEEALGICPVPKEVWRRLARLRIQRRNWKAGEAAYRKVLEYDPDDALAQTAVESLEIRAPR